MPVSPVVLPYQTPTDAPTALHRRWRVASFVALLPGLIVPFVSFSCARSPTQMLIESVTDILQPASSISTSTFTAGLLAIPFFLAIPLCAWTLLRIVRRHPPRVVAAIFGVMGVLGWLSFASVIVMGAIDGDGSLEAWALFGGAATILCFSLGIVVILFLKRIGHAQRVTAALAGPYAATLFFCLIGFASGREIGWYLSLTPASAALGELAVAGFVALRTPGAAKSASPNSSG